MGTRQPGHSFLPVKLPPAEQVILHKRESLRVRAFGWLAFLLWAMQVLAAGIGVALVRAGWITWARPLIDALFIVLVIVLVPLWMLGLCNWWLSTYVVTAEAIWKTPGLFAGRRRARAGLHLDQVSCVTWSSLRGFWSGLSVGHVELTTRAPGRTFSLCYVDAPMAIAEAIRSRVDALARRAAVPDAGGTAAPAAPRIVRTSFLLVMMNWVPVVALAWLVAGLWLTLHVIAAAEHTLWIVQYAALASAIVLIPWWAISFLRWWFRVYIVTDRRVIGREGLLNIMRRDLSLADVVSATVTTAGLGRFFDVGDLQVTTAGRSGSVVMRNISMPDLARRAVLETQELHRRQEAQLQMDEISGRLKGALHLTH